MIYLWFSFLKNIFKFVVGLISDIITYVINIINALISLLPLITILLILSIVGLVYYNTYTTAVPFIEKVWRCEIYPNYNLNIRPLLKAILNDIYTGLVTYINGLARIQKVLGSRFLFKSVATCVTGNIIDAPNILIKTSESLIVTIKNVLMWISNGAFKYSFPFYTVWTQTKSVLFRLIDFGECNCNVIPLWNFLRKSLDNANLSCGIHQIAEGLLNITQKIFTGLYALVIGILNAINTGNLSSIFDLQASNDLIKSCETLNAGIYYILTSLDEITEIFSCIVKGTTNSDGSSNDIENQYNMCISSGVLRLRIFSPLIPISTLIVRLPVSIMALGDTFPGFRVIGVFLDFILISVKDAAGGGVNPLKTYADTHWSFDIFWDTLRAPPLMLGRPSKLLDTFFFDTFYPNNNSLPSCNDIYINTFQSCTECPLPNILTFEDTICNLGEDIDTILTSFVTGYPSGIIRNVFCCLIKDSVRVGVSLLQFLSDMIKNTLSEGVTGLIVNFLGPRYNIDAVIDEIVGPSTSFTDYGLAGCIKIILLAIDSRIGCIGDIIQAIIKIIFETLRILYHGFISGIISLVLSLSSQSPPSVTFFDYFCISDVTCVDLEGILLSRFRIPRLEPRSIYLNYTILALPQSSTNNRLLECICYLFSSDFINSFITNGSAIIYPDICCGIYYGLRLVLEVLLALLEILLAILETFRNFVINGQDDIIPVLEYLACSDENANLCIPQSSILSDGQDFLTCPCLVILYVDDILNSQGNLFCLCDFISFITISLLNGVRTLSVLAETFLEIFNCITNDGFTNASPECGDELEDRIIFSFISAQDTLDSLAQSAGSLGCIVGTIFYFDCQDGSTNEAPIPCGSTPCRPSDSIRYVFQKTFELLSIIYKLPLQIIKEVFLGVFNSGTSTFNSVGDFLQQFLISLGEPLVGNPTAPNSVDRRGLVQYIGVLFNCLFGPTNNCYNDGSCFGQIFITFGDIISNVYYIIVDLITNVIRVIENLVTGGDVVTPLTNIFTDIFDLLAAFFNGGSLVLTLIKNILVAFLTVFLGPSLGNFINVILTTFVDVLIAIFNAIRAVLNFFGAGLKKRDVNISNTDMDIIINIIEETDRGSWCGRVYEEMNFYNNTNNNNIYDRLSTMNMTLVEEFMSTICMFGSILPSKIESIYSGGLNVNIFGEQDGKTENTNKKKRNNEEKNIIIPSDLFYKPQNLVEFMLDYSTTLGKYNKWTMFQGYDYNPDMTMVRENSEQYDYNMKKLNEEMNIQEEYWKNDSLRTNFGNEMKHVSFGSSMAVNTIIKYEQIEYSTNMLLLLQTSFNIIKYKYENTFSNLNEELKRSVDLDKREKSPYNNITTYYDLTNMYNYKHGNYNTVMDNNTVKKRQYKIYLWEEMKKRVNIITSLTSNTIEQKIVTLKREISEKIPLSESIVNYKMDKRDYKNLYGEEERLRRLIEYEKIFKRSIEATPCIICNCTFVDTYVSEFTDIINDMINNVVQNVSKVRPLYEIVTYSPVNFEDIPFYLIPLEYFNSLIGIDIGSTLIAYFSTSNMNPAIGYVGSRFTIKYNTAIPFISECDSDINLKCNYGYGLKEALKIIIVLCVIFTIILFLLIPQIGGIYSFLLSMIGFPMFILYPLTVIAWNFSPRCAKFEGDYTLSPRGIFFSFSIPECAGPEIFEVVDSIFGTCWSFIPPILVTNPGDVASCMNCNTTITILNCPEVTGIDGPISALAYFISKYIPSVYTQILLICNSYIDCSPILGNTFDDFNTTSSLNGTTVDIYDACAWLYAPTFFFVILIVILALVVVLYLIPLIINTVKNIIDIIFSFPFLVMFFESIIPRNITMPFDTPYPYIIQSTARNKQANYVNSKFTENRTLKRDLKYSRNNKKNK